MLNRTQSEEKHKKRKFTRDGSIAFWGGLVKLSAISLCGFGVILLKAPFRPSYGPQNDESREREENSKICEKPQFWAEDYALLMAV